MAASGRNSRGDASAITTGASRGGKRTDGGGRLIVSPDVRTSVLTMAVVGGILGILGGCSTILGIEDPHPDDGTGDGGLPVTDRLMLSLTDVRIAQLQRVRIRVTVVHNDGTMEDATANATLESDNQAIATSPGPGQVDGGLQDGMATITAKASRARSATLKVTVTTKQCRPLINELQTGGTTSADEWVEIVNPCTSAIDVTDWSLVYRGAAVTGTTDSNLMMTLAGALAPGQILLYAGVDYAGTNDGKWTLSSGIMGQNSGAIALRMGPKDTGPIADAVAYGTVTAGNPFIENAAAATMVNGRPAQRQPFDGRDDDDNSMDFVQVTTGTPRAPNAP